MRTVLIFLVILAPTAITACNYLSLAKCGYMGWKINRMANDTILDKIDERVKTCNFFNDCGEVILNCSKYEGPKRYDMQKAFDAGKTGCVLIHRMYKDDFVSCAIASEKHYWNEVCYRKYDPTKTDVYGAFAECVGEHVRKECTEDQYRIFEEAHDMLMDYLPYAIREKIN